MKDFTPSHPAARLCAACGMCCDGTLFHGMRIQPADSRRKLNGLGLKAKQGQFLQPCPAHEGNCCHIYRDRPQRCRDFSCRQLLEVEAGNLSEEAAANTIGAAKILVARVRALLRRAGENREHKPLAVRLAAAFTEPYDPSPEATAARKALQPARQELELVLNQNFRVEPLAASHPRAESRQPRTDQRPKSMK